MKTYNILIILYHTDLVHLQSSLLVRRRLQERRLRKQQEQKKAEFVDEEVVLWLIFTVITISIYSKQCWAFRSASCGLSASHLT